MRWHEDFRVHEGAEVAANVRAIEWNISSNNCLFFEKCRRADSCVTRTNERVTSRENSLHFNVAESLTCSQGAIELQGDAMNAAQHILEDQIEGEIVEARIAKLEAQAEQINGSVVDIKSDVRGIYGKLEAANSAIADLRVDVGKITAVIPTLATQAALKEVDGNVGKITALLPTLATQAALSEVTALIPTLATQAALSEVTALIPTLATQAALNEVKAVIPTLATQAALKEVEGKLQAALKEVEGKLVKWFIRTMIGLGAVTVGVIGLGISLFVAPDVAASRRGDSDRNERASESAPAEAPNNPRNP
jgi:hypothetical protein